ncbi:hypothetical protein D1007_55000 [Hordeum vulgare]|nr:hypothetical protein D1007_55000 [Hordeum vulgare]
MASFIPVPIELSSSEEDDLHFRTATFPLVNASALPEHVEAEDVIMEEEEDPDEVEFESGEDATDSDSAPFMLPPSPPTLRRSHSNVFMSFVDLEHFQNLAFAYINPPHPSPQALICRALLSGAGYPQVAIRASSQGAGPVVFGSAYEREISVLSSPFSCPINSVNLIRHDDTDNRFLFRLGTISALNLEDFPIEYWFPETITNSVVPFASPRSIRSA